MSLSRLRSVGALALALFVPASMVSGQSDAGQSDAWQSDAAQSEAAQFDPRQPMSAAISAIDALRAEHHVPGLAIAVVRDDRIVAMRAAGVRDVASGTIVTPTTPFAIGQVTHGLTSVLVAQLVEESVLEWDDPVRDHAAWFTPRDERLATLSVRDLLAQRTGHRSTPLLWTEGGMTWEQARDGWLTAELTHRPGTHVRPQTLAVAAAGRLAADLRGGAWFDVVTERVLAPLGMNDTRLTDGRAASTPVGYEWVTRDDRDKPPWLLQEDAPAGWWREVLARDRRAVTSAVGLQSTARDMAQWIVELNARTAEGAIVTPAMRDVLWTSVDESGHGMGWTRGAWGEATVMEQRGAVDGCMAHVVVLPQTRIGYVLLANTIAPAFVEAAHRVMMTTLTGDAPAGGPTAPAATTASDADGTQDVDRRLPDWPEVLALVQVRLGADAGLRVGSILLDGTVRVPEQGVSGTARAVMAGFDRFHQTYDFGPFGMAREVCFGVEGWRGVPGRPTEHVYATRREAITFRQPFVVMVDWPLMFRAASVTGREEMEVVVDGATSMEEVYVVRLEGAFLAPMTLRIGAESGLLHQRVIEVEGHPVVERLEDYRAVDGVRVPFRIVSEHPDWGPVIVQYESIETDTLFDWEPFVVHDAVEGG